MLDKGLGVDGEGFVLGVVRGRFLGFSGLVVFWGIEYVVFFFR